jgi:hypothetical protein
MIEGASNRVPEPPYWDLYRQGVREHPGLIDSLTEEQRTFITGKQEINSTDAGREILSRWEQRDEWKRQFPDDGAQLFGMVLWVTLFDDAATWRRVPKTINDRKVHVYHRVI